MQSRAVVRSATVLLAFVVGGVAACSISIDETVQGSGRSSSQLHPVGGFERIQLHDRLTVRVDVGSGPHVIVHGDENLLPYVEIDLNGNRLEVGVRDGFRLEPPPRVEILVPALTGFALSGSGSARVSGVGSREFEVSLSGSGDFSASGKTEDLAVSLSGSGEVDLVNLMAGTVDVDLSGSGSVRVNAQRTLAADVSGSGNVRYRGSPAVSPSVSGSGTIRRE